jgi:protein-L-isoaspartate(D-aspartate) O-methyltransferase
MNPDLDNDLTAPERWEERQAERAAMVEEQIARRDIRDPRVLDALRRVPRHRFIPRHSDAYSRAYTDGAQPIGQGQTISQPYIVALMTEMLELHGDERVLEIGAGSGYQTAVLALLAASVVAIERHPPLAENARRVLDELGISNVELLVGDGSRGWPSRAPYDVILVAAVAPEIPLPLTEQLAPGGRLILPVGPENGPQYLKLLRKAADGSVLVRDLGEVAFVPLIGAQGFGLPDDLGDLDI